jgi:hypothetical protein
MADEDPGGSTPDATAGVAQSRERDDAPRAERPARRKARSADDAFVVSPMLARHVRVGPYQRRPDDPVYRPLRIFALDPAVSRLDGAVALVNVPYEPLRPGPHGRLFEVVADGPVCDLDDRRVLIEQGYSPSRSDTRFQQQMVYAVCSSVYAAFKAALGRDPAWGFNRPDTDDGRDRHAGILEIHPRAFEGRNAHYDNTEGSLEFGWFTADGSTFGMMKGERVYTCLSHDVIVHELTHALLDGLRARFTVPTRIDVLAFHEAFADIVAIFQHFSYRDVVLTAIRRSRGQVTGGLLTDLARQLGRSTERPSPLRSAVDFQHGPRLRYDPKLDPHQLGSVLVLAVFDAFNTVYTRKTARYIRLATGGTCNQPMGELPADLQVVLADAASRLASQFLSICIRAVDYCPPVDLEFGEFLRAVITADRELVPDDPWAYREAWIDAFRERGIVVSGVTNLDEDSLVWRPPERPLAAVRPLSFGRLRFRGDPGRPASAGELKRQALALGRIISNPADTQLFGLRPPGDSIRAPTIESVRPARRIGPDGQVVFGIVAEITQQTIVEEEGSPRSAVFYGGSTVILGPEGEIRYVIGKGVQSKPRIAQQLEFLSTKRGQEYWRLARDVWQPAPTPFRRLHGEPVTEGS